MNSKERIETIFAGQTPDCIGRYEQSIYSSVASKILGHDAITGGTQVHRDEAEAYLAGGSAHDEFLDRIYNDRADLGRLLRFDMTGIPWMMPRPPAKKVSENEYLYGDPDGDWTVYRYNDDSETYGPVERSRKETTVDDLKKQVASMEKGAAAAPSGDRDFNPYLARLMGDFGDTLEVLGFGGISIPLEEAWLMACVTDPGLVAAYLDAQLAHTVKSIRRQAEMGVRVIWAGGDLADKNGPVYGPKVFRELVLPRLKRIIDECHKAGVYYLFRSDGNLQSVTDMMFLESQVDGYGEIDWEAGMDLADLKPRYPKVTFWGNVPPPVVRNKSKEEVLAAAKHCIDSVPDRRLILGCSNAILKDTPVENVFVLTEAVELYGSA